MKIKTFRAESVAAALKQVRQELGGEAMVLKTRKLDNIAGANRIEITACIGNDEHIQNNVKVTPTSTPNTNGLTEDVTKTKIESPSVAVANNNDAMQQVLSRLDALEGSIAKLFIQNHRIGLSVSSNLLHKLEDADVSTNDIADIINSVQQGVWSNSEIEQQEALRKILAERIAAVTVRDLHFKLGDRIVIMGPAGAGKSAVLGKLAFHLVSEHKLKVKLSSLDNFKVGGHEEIASYADLLGIEMTEDTIDEVEHDSNNNCVSLIDTPAMPNDQSSRNKLIETIEQFKPSHRLMVFSAATRTSDLKEICETAISFCPTHLVMSMTDLTHRYGGLFLAAQLLKRNLAFITDAPGGIGAIKTPDTDTLARKILKAKDMLCKS